MCYAKIKHAIPALPAVPAIPAVPVKPEDPLLPVDLGDTSAWFLSALAAPLEFDHMSSAAPIDNDWMNWLEGMSAPAASMQMPAIPNVAATQKQPQLPPQRQMPFLMDTPILSMDTNMLGLSSPEMSVNHLPSPQLSQTKGSPRNGSNNSTSTNNPAVRRKRRPAPSSDDEDDDDANDAAVKRQRNTEAARKSRARKAAKVCGLEQRVEMLEEEKGTLAVRVAVLQNEASAFAEREAQLKRRVEMLEKQLLESHRALVGRL
ncbi:hypothetical protein HDU83_005127 [Entophlyctis luteolus]|nr:hypothetical protein HDU82_003868 [Entophlyctis luteolus]KAJ3344505.1 hypothetical protein HDU83_005127 [Entophlyctis luteolus]KAJ3384644.1 hypothetical protein HDU84_002820 [Entophlyctis sp. JEL0112]